MTRFIRWFLPVLVTMFIFVACSSSDEADLPAATERETEEKSTPVQVAAVIVTPAAGPELINQGQQLYLTHCAACHQSNGEGNLNTFPALNANPFVLTGDPAPAISTVLHGRGVMPSFEGSLSVQQIAAILSYVRNTWDNEAPAVSDEQVQAVQADSSGSKVAQEQ